MVTYVLEQADTTNVILVVAVAIGLAVIGASDTIIAAVVLSLAVIGY